ncbi:MAG: alginate lyase [Candidatus Hydrogenedentota bacterium]|nr:MAG: alginate lyase [Candidatus Hydrogenedentota bacterium]
MLEMKVVCEKCNAELGHEDAACICSYECTFCADCASVMDHTCPNCGGELLQRPTRKPVN